MFIVARAVFKKSMENIPNLPEAFLTFASKSSIGPFHMANVHSILLTFDFSWQICWQGSKEGNCFPKSERKEPQTCTNLKKGPLTEGKCMRCVHTQTVLVADMSPVAMRAPEAFSLVLASTPPLGVWNNEVDLNSNAANFSTAPSRYGCIY